MSKPLVHLITFFTEITEFDNEKFRNSILPKDGVWRKFFESDCNSWFSLKNEYFKNVNFLIFLVNKL